MANEVARKVLFCIACENMIDMTNRGPDGSYACAIRAHYGEGDKKVLNPNQPCGTRFAVSAFPNGSFLVAFSSENAKQIVGSQRVLLN